VRVIWKILESKLFLAIVSLLISIVFWYYTVWLEGPQVVERIIEVPVKVKNAPERVMVEYNESSVEVRLKGSKNVVGSLTSKDVEAFVDLQGLNPGVYRLKVQTLVPPGVNVLAVRPSFLAISIEELVDKEVPVRVLTVGNPSEGFLIDEIRIVPNKAVVRGPKDLVEKIPYVFATLNVAGVDKDVNVALELRAEGISETSFPEITIIPSRVRVSLALKPGWPTKIVKVKVDIKGKPKEAFDLISVEAVPSHVTIMGPSSVLEKINEIVTSPVDVSELDRTSILELSIEPPEGVRLVDNSNVKVIVELKEKVLEREFLVPVTIRGSSVFLKWNISPKQIKLRLKGPYTKITSLNIQDIGVFIDVSGVETKEAILPVSVSVPPGLEIVSVTPSMVKVYTAK